VDCRILAIAIVDLANNINLKNNDLVESGESLFKFCYSQAALRVAKKMIAGIVRYVFLWCCPVLVCV